MGWRARTPIVAGLLIEDYLAKARVSTCPNSQVKIHLTDYHGPGARLLVAEAPTVGGFGKAMRPS